MLRQWLANLVICGIAAVLLRAHRLRCRLASALARQQSKVVINNIETLEGIDVDAATKQRFLFVLYNVSSGGQQVCVSSLLGNRVFLTCVDAAANFCCRRR